jgi:hypothetical protein
MLDTTKNITSLCHQLIKKPTNIKVGSNEDYLNLLENSDELNQDILLDKTSHSFYTNIQKKIAILLYKEFNEIFKVNDMDKSVLKKLNIKKQTKKD